MEIMAASGTIGFVAQTVDLQQLFLSMAMRLAPSAKCTRGKTCQILSLIIVSCKGVKHLELDHLAGLNDRLKSWRLMGVHGMIYVSQCRHCSSPCALRIDLILAVE
jgi:hypothetical protein